jgi:hypothetical protein
MRDAERRKAWESAHTPEQVAAAQAQRLARRKLKSRLRTQVQRSRWECISGALKLSIRKETRSVQLAHGFIRDRSYLDMERTCYTRPDWDRVHELVALHMYGDPRIFLQRFAQWVDAARAADNFKGHEPTRHEILVKLLWKRERLDVAIKAFGGGER